MQGGGPGGYFLAGHGSRQPEVRPDRENVKPDGLDEIFLPADVGRWDGPTARVTNAIADYEFRAWIQRILDKGALVWGIVDACHSGTMLRDVPGRKSLEKVRGVAPQELGIPEAAIERVRDKAVPRLAVPNPTRPGRGACWSQQRFPRTSWRSMPVKTSSRKSNSRCRLTRRRPSSTGC